MVVTGADIGPARGGDAANGRACDHDGGRRLGPGVSVVRGSRRSGTTTHGGEQERASRPSAAMTVAGAGGVECWRPTGGRDDGTRG